MKKPQKLPNWKTSVENLSFYYVFGNDSFQSVFWKVSETFLFYNKSNDSI